MILSDWQTVKVLHEQRLEDVKEEQADTRKQGFLRLPRFGLGIRTRREQNVANDE